MSDEQKLFDTLVPGEEGFPSASEAGVDAWLRARADRFAAPLAEVLARLPANFAMLDTDSREVAVKAAERASPSAFHALTTGVYSAYYAAPTTRSVIEARTGYAARPPQPEGYAMKPFEAALVALPASRPPSWRKA